jgi:hypothetical protein
LSIHQEEPACSAIEQRILSGDDPRDALTDPFVADHLTECRECSEFFESLEKIKPALDRYRVLEPSEDLIETVLNRALRLRPANRITERAPVHAGMLRVLLAGLVSLPLVILINTLMGWALYELAASVLPRTIALYCMGLFAVWASLAVSCGYASLPLLSTLVRKPAGRLAVIAET